MNMSKYYIATDTCIYKVDYLKFRENSLKVNGIVKDFLLSNGIEASKYAIHLDRLHIIPTERDLDTIGDQLNLKEYHGLRSFKKSSHLNKSFDNILETKNIEVLDKPLLWMYTRNSYGRMNVSTSIIGDTMYLKVSTDTDKPLQLPGLVEIKASEYYLAIESIEVNM